MKDAPRRRTPPSLAALLGAAALPPGVQSETLMHRALRAFRAEGPPPPRRRRQRTRRLLSEHRTKKGPGRGAPPFSQHGAPKAKAPSRWVTAEDFLVYGHEPPRELPGDRDARMREQRAANRASRRARRAAGLPERG